ncbi:MAG: PAS domain S-box protein, partial [Ignavibacteriae bacterium]|nr:PAS domain S-box protein [Ignavibacteriota bacterium]
GKILNTIYDEKNGARFLKEYNEFLSSNKTFERKEKKLTFLNGKKFTFEASYSRIKLSGENYILGIFRDITERKLAEEADNSHRKQLRAVLDTVPSYIFAKDYDGKFLMVNKSLSDLFGVSPEEVVGKSDVDYGASKEQIKGYITADRKVIDSGEPLLISEEQVLRKDGSLGWFQTNKVPYQHPDTNKPAILGVAVDITERKQAEEKLKESEIKYKNLYNNAEVALFDSSINNAIIINCNQKFCDLFGFESPENAIGQSVLQLYVNPEHREEIRKVITKSNYLNNYTVHFKNIKTEKKFYGQLTMRIEEDGDTYVGTIVDITKQVLVEKEILIAKEKAEEMSRLKTNFLANMSHEIRTPLNGILGFARILEDELKDPSYLEYTNAIKISGLRLLETLDMILAFSKL